MHEITFSPPLPRGGRGSGGWGQEGKLKAGAAGDQQGKPPSGTTAAGIARAARVQARGCKGRSPLHKITFSLPLPAGKGAGGMGAGRQTKGRGGRQPTRQAPLGRHSGTGRSIRVLQTRQKRLSRFCNTRHPSRHAGAQAKAGTGRERRLPPIIIRSRKVLGGVGDSFKSPPAHPRILASPYPRIPVSHSPRQARRRRARMQKPAVRQAAGRRTATATPQRAEEGRERDREEPSMQTGETEENSEVKVSLI